MKQGVPEMGPHSSGPSLCCQVPTGRQAPSRHTSSGVQSSLEGCFPYNDNQTNICLAKYLPGVASTEIDRYTVVLL